MNLANESFEQRSEVDIDAIVDLYIPEPHSESGRSYPTFEHGARGAYFHDGSPMRRMVRDDLALSLWVDRLHAELATAHKDRIDFTAEYDNRRFRVHREETTEGWLNTLRRLPSQCPTLDDLSFTNPAARDFLMLPTFNQGGLILFAALNGQGKSTVAGATIKSRLMKFHGEGFSLEDPAELPLAGFHGEGTFRQTEVKNGDWAGAMGKFGRLLPASRPAILYIGEVRDPECAAETIKLALAGALVITTVHSDNAISALARMVALAESHLKEATALMLAQALRLVVHQKLVLSPQERGWARGQISTTMLYSNQESSPVAVALRDKKFEQMKSTLNQQKTLFDNHTRTTPTSELLRKLQGT